MTDFRKIASYMIGGIIATGIDMGLLYLLTEYLHIHYMWSQGISFVISFIFGFLFQKYITFQNKNSNHLKQGLLFLGFQLVGLGINLIVLHISVEWIGIHYMIGSLLSKGIVFIRNFVMNQKFNFK